MKLFKKKGTNIKFVPFFILVSLLFISCDSGTSSSETKVNSSINSLNITGQVVDGYIKNATVCIDENKNEQCDVNEVSTISDENGSYSFNNYNMKSETFFPILAIGGIDIATNKPFDESIYGIINYHNEKNMKILISPTTDLNAREAIKAKNNNQNWVHFIKPNPMEKLSEFSTVQELQSLKKVIKSLHTSISYKDIKDELINQNFWSSRDNLNITNFINTLENKLNISIDTNKKTLAINQISLNTELFRELEINSNFKKEEFNNIQNEIEKDISNILKRIEDGGTSVNASLSNFKKKLKKNSFDINIPKEKSYNTPPTFPKFEEFNTVSSNISSSGNYSDYNYAGWSLVKNQFNNQNFSTIAPNADVILTYKDNTWYGYSPNGAFREEIVRLNIQNIDKLNSSDAFWVYYDKQKSSFMNGVRGSNKQIVLKQGWNLSSLSNIESSILLKSYFTSNDIESLWSYSNRSKKWSAYSAFENIQNDLKIDENITVIDRIGSNDAFWIYSYHDVNISIVQKAPIFLTTESIIDVNESTMSEFYIEAIDPNGDIFTYNIKGNDKDYFRIKDKKIVFKITSMNTKPKKKYEINIEINDSLHTVSKEFTININLRAENNYTAEYSNIVGNDEFLSRQLYLDENHLNILHLHKDYNGSITKPIIQVVERGLDDTHEDLIANIHLPTSFSAILNIETNITKRNNSFAHGTSVAGIIAARGFNGIGVRGIVPFGKIAYFNKARNGSSLYDIRFAWGYGPRANDIDISNNSWGVCSNFNTSIDKVLKYGSTNLRDKKGRIYVMSAGNERKRTSRCGSGSTNLSTYMNNPYMIVVAAMSIYDNNVESMFRKADDKIADTSNPGANILVSAYGSGGIWSSYGAYNLKYAAFSGTSAAAPMVSGAIGLLLEACPTLNYRDVRYLLATTAIKVDSSNPSWVQTASNLHYSTDYGFGKLDITSAINTCKDDYSILSNQHNISEIKTVNENIQNNGTKLNISIDINSIFANKVEWVAIYLEGQVDDIGDFEFNLISPSGTKIQLLHGNNGAGAINYNNIGKYDIRSSNAKIDDINGNEFRLSSVGFLDEGVVGTWNLEISDKNSTNNQIHRRIKRIKLEILGY